MRLQRSKKAQTVIVMLLLSALCIMAMGFTVYLLATRSLSEEVEKAYRSSLQRTQDQVSSYFKQIDQAILQFEKLPAVESLASPWTEEDGIGLISVQETMLRMQTSLEDVDNIALYRVSSGRLFSTNRQVTAFQDDYLNVIGAFEQTGKKVALLNLTVHDTPTTVYVRKLPVFQTTQDLYMIIHLNQQFFDHILGLPDGEQGTYFILDERRDILQARGALGRTTLESEIVPLVKEGKPKAADDLFVAYLPPSYQDWIFGFAIPNHVLFAKIGSLRNVIFAIAGLLLTLAVLITLLATGRLWRGWSELVSLVEDSSPARAGTSAGEPVRTPDPDPDEFRHVYDTVRRIKANRDELQERIKELTPEIKATIFRSLLLKGIRSQQDRDKCERYQLPLAEEGEFGCLAVQIDQYRSLETLYSEIDLYYFKYGISSVIQEVIDTKGSGMVTAWGEDRFMAALTLPAAVPEEAKAAVREAAQTIRDFVRHYFPFTVSIGVSRLRKDYAYLNVSSQEAEEALKHKLVAGKNEVIPIEEFGGETESPGVPFSFRELENDILYAVRSLDRGLAYGYIDRLRELEGVRTIHYQWLQSRMIDLTLFLYRSVGQSLSRPLAEPVAAEWLELSTLEEWSDWLKTRACDLLIAELEEEHRGHMRRAAEQLTGFIDAHNEEDIRLESCCKALGLPVTLGKQALKEVHDATFSDYLLASRIAKAKHWLRHTEMSIDEMASRLQYSNAQNFSRTFKKFVGMPPGQYRKESRGEG